MAAFIPGASPPLVKTAIRFIKIVYSNIWDRQITASRIGTEEPWISSIQRLFRVRRVEATFAKHRQMADRH